MFLKIIPTLLIITNIHASIFGGPIDIDHDPRYRPSRDINKKDVPKCSVDRLGQTFLLNQKNNSITDVFDLLLTTSKGSEIVFAVQDKVLRGQLVIKNLSSLVRQARALSSKTVALFDVTQSPAAIYVNFEDELGLLVNFFAHEASHAIDPKIRKFYEEDIKTYEEYKKVYNSFGLNIDPNKYLTAQETQIMNDAWELKEKKMQRNSYLAERFAFDEQGIVTSELASSNDCFNRYIEDHQKLNGLKLYTHTPDEHIFNSYNINPKYIYP